MTRDIENKILAASSLRAAAAAQHPHQLVVPDLPLLGARGLRTAAARGAAAAAAEQLLQGLRRRPAPRAARRRGRTARTSRRRRAC